jgi:hypothetical protein
MNMKQIGTLGVLAALAAGAASLSMASGPQGFATDKRGQIVFPGLTQKANDVMSITIRDFERSFTVERREDGFYNKESGYPVKPEAYRDLVGSAALLTFEETKTADPARMADLGLAEPGAAPEAVGRDMAFRDAKGNVLAALTVGNADATVGGARGGTFIKLPDQKQAWLVRGQMRVPVPHAAWYEINFINIQRDSLAGITITGGGMDEIITKAEKKGDDITLVNAPEGRVGDGSKLMRLGFMVDPISFQDVRKAEGAASADARKMIVTSWKGYTITYTAIGDVADGWVRFTTQLTSDLGKEEAEDFRRKTEGFDFKLAQHEIDMLRWSMKDVSQEPKS